MFGTDDEEKNRRAVAFSRVTPGTLFVLRKEDEAPRHFIAGERQVDGSHALVELTQANRLLIASGQAATAITMTKADASEYYLAVLGEEGS